MRRYSRGETPVTTFALAERAAELSNVRFIRPSPHWSDSATLSSSYGDWYELTQTGPMIPSETFVLPDYCGGSDYSGSLLEVTNYKALLGMIPDDYEDGLEYVTYTGGHGTFALAIRIDALTEEILESLESLDDYPLLDEGLHSELEIEAQNEAWDSWAKSEFKTELGRHMWTVFESSTRADQRAEETDEAYQTRLNATEEYLSDECGGISDSDLGELFYKMADRANIYWENEQGSDMAIDVERVVSRGLEAPRRDANDSSPDHWQEYKRTSYNELCALIRDAMSATKYDLGIVRFVDPDQLTFQFATAS
jgi:hypothetical protein